MFRYAAILFVTAAALISTPLRLSAIQPPAAPTEQTQTDKLPIGYAAADADNDGAITRAELKTYLNERLVDHAIPHRKLFKRLDTDKSRTLSESEFEKRHEVVAEMLRVDQPSEEDLVTWWIDYITGANSDAPQDPGADYVPFRGLGQPMDDKAIYGALYNRYYDLTKTKWPKTKLQNVPKSIVCNVDAKNNRMPNSVLDLIDSTVLIAGGGRRFFTAGAVVISSDGLAVTAYHVAEGMKKSNLVAMTSDGKCHRITEFLAGDSNRDIALIRIEGNDFHAAKIAGKVPAMGSDLVMMHHSENRFYTYDRGYVMRHPKLGKHAWMEISADYAPGGSGCGIFNDKHELIGLVSIIQYGDGPSMAEGFPEGLQWDESDEEYADEDAILLVKHAVPLTAIQSLFKNTDEIAK